MGQADVYKNIVNLDFKIQTDKPLQTGNVKNTWSQKKNKHQNLMENSLRVCLVLW
jgi:hypothetical protein